jgi:hypothetical protein
MWDGVEWRMELGGGQEDQGEDCLRRVKQWDKRKKTRQEWTRTRENLKKER